MALSPTKPKEASGATGQRTAKGTDTVSTSQGALDYCQLHPPVCETTVHRAVCKEDNGTATFDRVIEKFQEADGRIGRGGTNPLRRFMSKTFIFKDGEVLRPLFLQRWRHHDNHRAAVPIGRGNGCGYRERDECLTHSDFVSQDESWPFREPPQNFSCGSFLTSSIFDANTLVDKQMDGLKIRVPRLHVGNPSNTVFT